MPARETPSKLNSTDSPRVSLVLGTVGRVAPLARLADSLAAQTEKRFELLVIDQNADDRLADTLAAMRERGLDVHHIRQRERSLSQARNAGIARARAPLVGFPDDDGWLDPDCLACVWARATAAGPNTAPTDADRDTEAVVRSVIAHWVELQPDGPAASPGEPLRESDWRRFRGGNASSITLFVRRSALHRVGGFDTRFGVGRFYGAGEETDLLLRLLAGGEPLVREPAARVHHPPPQGLAGGSQTFAAVRARARGTGALYAKHALPFSVVVRGLLSPWPQALRHHAGRAGLMHAAAISVGRLEGMLQWRRERGQS
ncbi:MAG: glycosyltransferase [Burkholderiaceae bacterium]